MSTLNIEEIRGAGCGLKDEERQLAKSLFFTSIKEGGFGAISIEAHCDAALVGTWCNVAKHCWEQVPQNIKNSPDSCQTVTDVTAAIDRMLKQMEMEIAWFPGQKVLARWDTDQGNDPMLSKLKTLSELGGINNLSKLRGKGKTQGRLSMITNMLNANKIQNHILINLTKFPIDRTNSDGRSNPLYRQFVSQRGSISMRFLNRSHLSNKARGFTPFELRLTILLRLMIPLVPGKFDCARCNMKNVHYNEHLERCKKMHVTTNKKNGEPLPDDQYRYVESRGRVSAIHSDLKNMMKAHWRKIPDVAIGLVREKLHPVVPSLLLVRKDVIFWREA